MARLFRLAAEHLRQYPLPDSDQREIDQAIDALQAPWGARIAKAFRQVFDPDATFAAGEVARKVSAHLMTKVRELGLRPYKAPQPLPVITEDEVMLVCWMAVESE